LRPFHIEDTTPLFDAICESIRPLCAWMTWCRPDYDIEQCRTFILQSQRAWQKGEQYNFAISSVQDGTLLGSVGINQINRAHNVANLGYWIRTFKTGQGFAASGIQLAARFGLRDLGLSRLEIIVPLGNVASQKTALRAGAREEGTLRKKILLSGTPHDAIIYSLVLEDLIPAGG
jgi:RimJ/RimL family protein N-acetyltransferase